MAAADTHAMTALSNGHKRPKKGQQKATTALFHTGGALSKENQRCLRASPVLPRNFPVPRLPSDQHAGKNVLDLFHAPTQKCSQPSEITGSIRKNYV